MRMGKTTNSRTAINKRGEYIVEAAISFPVFLIAMVIMLSIILMYACIENSNFILATELRRAAIEARVPETGALIPHRISKRILEENSIAKSANLTDYRYRQTAFGIDELICLKYTLRMEANNPLDLASEAEYDLSLVTRAYVGRERELLPMSEDELSHSESESVYIFPKRGEKFHKKGCNVLHAAYTSTVLSKSLKRKYGSCPKCHSSKASEGSIVYIFENEGENYHLAGCNTLERNYIEVTRKIAKRRGYEACNKCGG